MRSEAMKQRPPIVDLLASELEGASPETVLATVAERFAGHIACASSLGLEDQVLAAMIADSALPIPVFTLDTGRLFPETYDLIAETSQMLGTPIRVYLPEAAEVEEMVTLLGVNLFRDSVAARKRCCEVRKLRPLARALDGLDAWVCGLRQSQSAGRAMTEVVEWDGANELIRINPVATWSAERVRSYIRAHSIPYNPLHDEGFPSIGCAPCTRAVPSGTDQRSGRWWWEGDASRECGLHARDPAADPCPADVRTHGRVRP
jgi:phosphoadenosine phosphosulfate reductase